MTVRPKRGTRPSAPDSSASLRPVRILREVLGAAVAYVLLVVAESLIHPSLAVALATGRALGRVDRYPVIGWLVDLLHSMPIPQSVATVLYVGGHYVGTTAVVLFLIIRCPSVWTHARWALLATIGVALCLYAALPVAPPWMVTGVDLTPWAHPATTAAGLDVVASFPSLHVAIACWAALSLRAAGFSRSVWLYPLAIAVIVVATGNHYVADLVGGAALAIGCWYAAGAVAGCARRRAAAAEGDRRTPAETAVGAVAA